MTTAAPTATPTPVPTVAAGDKGLYAVINPAFGGQFPAFTSALGEPYVDGALILSEWSQIEPAQGSYNFAPLDQWVDAAVTNHKKISLGVFAGNQTPQWIFGLGAQAVTFQNYDYDPGGAPVCKPLTLAAPYDPTFIAQYDAMMAAVAAHIRTMIVPGYPAGAAYDALRIVKLDGINNTTEELRLYAGTFTAAYPGPCDEYAVPSPNAVWAAAGYTPTKIMAAWLAMANNIATLFPDKVLSTDVIQTIALPAVNDAGQVYQTSVGELDPVTNQIIALGLANFPGRYAVQWDGLNQSVPDPAVTMAGAQGAIVAWQTNDRLGTQGSACDGGTNGVDFTCTPQQYQALLDNGIQLGGQWIEFVAQDTAIFPAQLQQAHQELTTP